MGRQCILTKYLRVGAKKVVLLELQQMNGDRKISTKSIEKRIIKEIQDLLHDVILQRIAAGNHKEKTKDKTASDCIFTGKYVQFGYVFKKRYEHQILLMSDTSDSEDEESYHRSFVVHDEKIAVFYCSIDASSPSKMSQLVKCLQNESATPTQPSVSSYFHRKPTGCSQRSQGQSSGSGSKGKKVDQGEEMPLECEIESCQEVETCANDARLENEEVHMPVDDKEKNEKMSKEEKLNVIKNLVKRSGPCLSKKRKRKEKTPPSNNVKTDKNFVKKNDTDKITIDTCTSSDPSPTGKFESNVESVKSTKCISQKTTESASEVEIISECDSSPELKRKRRNKQDIEEENSYSQENTQSQGKPLKNQNIDNDSDDQMANGYKITPCEVTVDDLKSRKSSKDAVSGAVVLRVDQVSGFVKSKNLKTYSRKEKVKTEKKLWKDVRDSSLLESKKMSKSDAVLVVSDENSLDIGNFGDKDDDLHLHVLAQESSKTCAEDSILPEISFLKRTRSHNAKSHRNSDFEKEEKSSSKPDNSVFPDEEEDCLTASEVRRKDASVFKISAKKSDKDTEKVEEVHVEGSPKFTRASGKQNFRNQVSSSEESDAELVFRSKRNQKRIQQILSSVSIEESDDLEEEPVPVSKVRRNRLHQILSSNTIDDKEALDKSSGEENSSNKENNEEKSKNSCVFGRTDETASSSTAMKIDPEDPLPKLRCKTSKEKKNSKKNVGGNFTSLVKGIFEKKDNGQKTLDALFSSKSSKFSKEQKKDSKDVFDFDDELDCAEMEDSILDTGLADSLWREIRSFHSVDQLNQEHLHFLVDYHKNYLQDVFRGKVLSDRHLTYKMGGKQRKDLNYQVHLGLFTDEQQDVVMDTLLKIFCKKRHKYLDYTMKVLLPEMLIRIYMDVQSVSYEEAENQMQDAVKVDGAIYH